MATYVEGEAAETSSDEEQYVFNLSYMKVNKYGEKQKLIYFYDLLNAKLIFIPDTF